jgi:hypothetical protein
MFHSRRLRKSVTRRYRLFGRSLPRTEQRGRIFVQINRRVRMFAQNGSWREWIDLAFKARLHGLGFARIRHDRDDLPGAENLSNGHGDSTLGDIGETGEPALIHLLLSASLVKFHNQVGFQGLKIGRRIVEREVRVFADACESKIHRLGLQFRANLFRNLFRIALAVQKMVLRDSCFVNEALEQIFSKARGVRDRQAYVFIQMEKLDATPIDVRSGSQFVQKFKLRRARRRHETRRRSGL